MWTSTPERNFKEHKYNSGTNSDAILLLILLIKIIIIDFIYNVEIRLSWQKYQESLISKCEHDPTYRW